MQITKKFFTQMFATIVLFAGMVTSLAAAEVAGAWAVSFTTDGGAGSMELMIEQAGDELTGSVSGDVGNAPIMGKVENDTVTFSHVLPDYGVSAAYTGKLEGNTITGTVSFADGAATGNFRAQKK